VNNHPAEEWGFKVPGEEKRDAGRSTGKEGERRGRNGTEIKSLSSLWAPNRGNLVGGGQKSEPQGKKGRGQKST